MEKINWGIIGLGNIAHKFSEAFEQTENSNLLSVASNNKDKINFFKEKYKLENKFLFNDYNDLINCKEVDIIYIALPNFLHHKWASKCIEGNKHVLLEKPATLNLQEAKDLKKKIEVKDLFFGEAFMYRHHPQINSIINLIKDNKIGNLLSMQSNFGIDIFTQRKFFFFKRKKKIDKNSRYLNKDFGGGCILDLGCYPSSFSLLIGSLAGSTNFELTNVMKEVGETKVDIDSSAEIIFKSGFRSRIYSSFKKKLGSKSIIIGDKGSIDISNTWLNKNNTIKVNSDKNYSIEFKKSKNIYSYQIESTSKNLLNKIYKPTFPAMSMSETLQNMEILDEWLCL